MAFSDTVKRVLELAYAIEDYWHAELPKRHPHYPIIGPGEDSGPPPPQEEELRALLGSLPPDDVYTLLALIDVGRAIAPVRELDTLRRRAREKYPDLDFVIDMLAERPSRVSFLADALAELSAAGADVDRLSPAPV